MNTAQPDTNKIIIEQRVEIHGATRWVGFFHNDRNPLLIINYNDTHYATPLYCPHAHASLLHAKLNTKGEIICPKHGLASSLVHSSSSFKVILDDGVFIVDNLDRKRIPTASIEPDDIDDNTSSEIESLKTVNSALQRKVLTNLESMDLMLSQVEHKKAELEEKNFNLSSANELIDGITNSIDEFLVVTDNQGRITRLNRYAENILQCKAHEIIGSSPDYLLQDATLAEIIDSFPASSWDHRPYLYRAVYTESHFQKEVIFQDPLGRHKKISQKIFLLKGTLLYSQFGKEEGLILTGTDISVIKAKEQQKRAQDLEEHLSQLKGTLETLGQGVAMFSTDGNLQLWNQPFIEISSMAHEEIFHKQRYENLFLNNYHILHSEEQPQIEVIKESKHQWLQVQNSGKLVECESSPMPKNGFVITTRDITQSRKNEEHIRLLSTTVEQSSSEVIITDTQGTIVYVNPMFTENTGYTAEEAIGQNSNLVQSGEMPISFYQNLWETIKQSKRWKGEIINRKKNGEEFWQSMSITPILDTEGNISHYLSLKSDISKQKDAEKQLRYQAENDLLTNLPNRPVLLKQLEIAIQKSRTENVCSAVLFMDLDNFKDVNDTLGHLSGDQLLKLVALRLKHCISENDLIARLGGDEFAIIQRNIESTSEPGELAEKIIKAVTSPFKVEEHLLHIGISIGITLIPDDGNTTSALLSNSDIAMYSAKDNSGSQYKFFDQELQLSIQRKRKIEVHLHTAISDNELTLLFQPKINISNNKVVGAEALLRWNSNELGPVSPSEFIPIAEQSGLIIELGEWVLKRALYLLNSWQERGFNIPKIAVNLSPVQLKDVNLIPDIKKLVENYKIDKDFLELEITETAAMADPEFAESQLRAMRALGISLAMDDFGTGYSSLSYLASLPIDRIKIDRSFVNDIEHSDQAKAIIESIIHLGNILKKTVIAEGVEDKAQLELLGQLGCHEAQGYYISKPVPADQFIEEFIE
ncbi:MULTISPECIES: EAL domain-containing protein [unclassified Neptuniibacter]|uniref:EAL domain-containing protein n=1 Tax=unclassified Neptuniibacter TaxID=2630693 RepID=UPI0025D754AD|nr:MULTISPECIES: EAL domain-containing protein [unclassified Neptuniibacter]|tara:strand:- start:10302 stop:13253 length:2952 start_codon:yes stop_codon:yes gene_type:complete